MDPNPSSPSRRKMKFKPRKLTPRSKSQSQATETEEQREDRAVEQALLRHLNYIKSSILLFSSYVSHGEGYCYKYQRRMPCLMSCEDLGRREPKVESKSIAQVAFGPVDSSPRLRTYGIGKGGKSSSSSASEYFANEQNSTAIEDQSDSSMIDVTNDTSDASARKIKREYKEPWDYHNSYYPTTLPLRKPYSGDPEILDEEEFGEAATNKEYDENAINSAAELGLLDKSEQQRMLLFQLPLLPLVKESMSKKGKEKMGTSTVSGEPKKGRSALEELPGGYMGKMLVHKSGKIKLKLGEKLFEVSPGLNCICPQDVVAMNTAQKNCCVLGELSKRVVATPDLDSIDL